MTTEQWQRVKSAYQTAREVPLERRAAALAALCGSDPEIQHEVESLLAADCADDFAEPPTLAAGAPSLLAEALSLNGTRIGAFIIDSPIGSGGMADVYRARRADGEFEQQVAIKLIQPGMHAATLLRRFHIERQTLARLSHPSIARLLDGGHAPDGRPYLVMELVEGVPIDRYCDSGRLTTRDRLRLFQQVCEAVQYAHNNLVLHCDLKPANILVTGVGIPKLLDFGVARMLCPEEHVAMTASTVPGRRFLTPEYASPEQLRGEALTTASDVYALGLLLYQLLTGRRPYRFRSRALPEIERTVLESDPERPSTIVLRAVNTHQDELPTETPESIGAARGVRPDALSRLLVGDLDNIVLMALRKDPAKRYASVEAMRLDIERHLAGLPILARKPSATYRASKFVRRNRIACAAGAAAALSLVFGSATTVWQARIAERERDVARANLVRAERVVEFLVELFDVSDPDRSRGETVTARELLDRGAERIRTDLRDQPQDRAKLLHTIGRVYIRLGLHSQAVELLTDAVAIMEQNQSAGLPKALKDLGGATVQSGDSPKGVTLLRRALELSRQAGGGEDLAVAEMMNNLGWALQQQRKPDEAEPLLRASLETRLAELGQDHPDVAVSRNNLAGLLADRGDWTQAEALLRAALDSELRTAGDDAPDVQRRRSNLGFVLHSQGKYAEALVLYEQALAIRRRVLTNRHPETIITISNIGGLLADQGEYAAAELRFHEALDACQELQGSEHPETARAKSNLAFALLKQNKLDDAEPLAREALEVQRTRLGREHLLVSTTLLRLGELLLRSGRFEEADEAIEEACTIREALPHGHRGRAECEALRGRLLLGRNKPVEAERHLRNAWAHFSESGHGASLVEVLEDLAEAYCRQGQSAEEVRFRRLKDELKSKRGAAPRPADSR